MRPNEDLFQLIQSMSREERGYFSKYADIHAKGGENNYKRLFSLICSIDDPTDEKVRKRLAGDPLLDYFSTAKNQLYFILLRTMRFSQRDLGFVNRTSELLSECDLLNARGLRNQMQKSMRRAEEFVFSNELVLPALELCDRNFDFHFEDHLGPTDLEQRMETLFRLREKIMDDLHEQHRMERWLVKMQLAIMRKNLSESSRNAGIRNILALLEQEESRKPSTTIGRYLFAIIQATGAEAMGNWSGAYSSYSQAIEIICVRRDQSFRFPMRHIRCLEGKARVAMKLGEKKDVIHHINLLKRLPSMHPVFSGIKFQFEIANAIHLLELELFYSWGELKKGAELTHYLLKEMEKNALAMTTQTRMELWIRMSTMLFCCGEYKQALQLLNKVYSERFEHLDRSLVGFCRVYYLILHLELGNWDHVYYAFRSVQRRMEKEGSLGNTERHILTYVRSKVFKGKGQPRIFNLERFSRELLWLKNDPGEARAFRFFDFSCWAESMERGCSIQATMERRRKDEKEISREAIPA
ncbi:MAG: hypothetical protein ACK40M_07980 [Flavobacteriales bacterium]